MIVIMDEICAGFTMVIQTVCGLVQKVMMNATDTLSVFRSTCHNVIGMLCLD